MKWVRRAILLLVFAAIVVVIVFALRPKPVPVETAKVERGAFVETVEEPGKTRVRERFVVSAPVSGELARIEKKAGDAIDSDEVVATIKPIAPAMFDVRTKAELEARVRTATASNVLAKSAVEKAKALQAYAKTERDRIAGLVEKGSLPGRDLEKADLDLLIAEKDVRSAELSARVSAFELEVARAASGSTATKSEGAWTVKSPLKGRILRVLQSSEGVVAAGTPLLEVADATDLEVVVAVLTSDAVRMKPGARSLLEGWGGPEALEGRVRNVEPSGYTKISALGVEEQRVDVVIDIVSPPAKWAALGDGFRVETKTIVHQQGDAVKTTSAALFRDGDAWALFLVQNGKAIKRRVALERRNGFEAVLGGVEPGTTVIAFPSPDVADGRAVVAR